MVEGWELFPYDRGGSSLVLPAPHLHIPEAGEVPAPRATRGDSGRQSLGPLRPRDYPGRTKRIPVGDRASFAMLGRRPPAMPTVAPVISRKCRRVEPEVM